MGNEKLRDEFLEKKVELYSSSTCDLIRADFLANVLQQWRTFTKAKTLVFLKYDGKFYAGDAVDRLKSNRISFQ